MQFQLLFSAPAIGDYDGSININSDDPDDPLTGFSVTGHGVGIPEAAEPAADRDDGRLRNTPNPFNPSTRIRFYASHEDDAEVRIFSVRGRLVRTLHAGAVATGRNEVQWSGRDDRGSAVATGVYFYQFYLDGKRTGATGRALLLK